MLAFCKRLSLVLGAVAGLAFASGSANAQTTVTDTFDVLITITAECVLTNPTNMNFGTEGVLDTAVNASATFDVQCTDTTPFDMGLDQGLHTTRRMNDGGTNYVDYELYADAGHTDVWGETIGTDTETATGDGTAITYTVHGQVPVQTTPAPGNYTDTVEIQVTY